MSLDILDAPLRITWDLNHRGKPLLADDQLLEIADRLIDAGVFSVLLDERPLLSSALKPLVETLSSGGCQLALILGDNPQELDNLAYLAPGQALFVDAGHWLGKPQGLQQLEAFFLQLDKAGCQASLLWVPGGGQLRHLPALLALCQRLKLPCFKLPNHKIGANSEPVGEAGLLGPADLVELKALLQENPLDTTTIKLEVHDLFLWELLFPQGGGQRSEYGGCQAGNSLGHVTANGDLWPCSSWPLVLGNLLQNDLLTLWDSAARFRVREKVSLKPGDCTGCSDYHLCFGGCRGLALNCRQDGFQRDPLCAGPRHNEAD